MKPFFTLAVLVFLIATAKPDIRYVSKSGSSTPPFMSWETASDSIQKCINFCNDGDTIYVANGVYQENLNVNKIISLSGISMDSTVIDGTGLANTTIYAPGGVFNIQNFTIIGNDSQNAIVMQTSQSILNINSCRIRNGHYGIFCQGGEINNVIITKCVWAFVGGCSSDTCHYSIKNSIILLDTYDSGGIITLVGSYYKIYNNAIIFDGGNLGPYTGISSNPNGIEIINNIVSGFTSGITCHPWDTSFIFNNIITNTQIGIELSDNKVRVRNCVLRNIGTAISGGFTQAFIDYNLIFNVGRIGSGALTFGTHNLYSDPMFIKDKQPDSTFAFDYHLQKFSPCIDNGDPSILDINGTTSDIGLYGGPLGESYSYEDLPPRAPSNFTAEVNNSEVTLKWMKNTEADTNYYNVYRDSIPNFIIDSTKLISRQKDTLFTESLPKTLRHIYYKLTAEDKQGNVSDPSEEKVISYTSAEENYAVVESFQLFQNYPNPFNPSTTISYKLKERGYVKLLVYDIKGEIIKVLVNKEQEAGYYETEFNGSGLASGIYIYRIEVIGKGSIPVFSDMKKTVLLK